MFSASCKFKMADSILNTFIFSFAPKSHLKKVPKGAFAWSKNFSLAHHHMNDVTWLITTNNFCNLFITKTTSHLLFQIWTEHTFYVLLKFLHESICIWSKTENAWLEIFINPDLERQFQNERGTMNMSSQRDANTLLSHFWHAAGLKRKVF